MSEATSEATGQRYGIQRVSHAWERSPSALYARRTSEQKRQEGEKPTRRSEAQGSCVRWRDSDLCPRNRARYKFL